MTANPALPTHKRSHALPAILFAGLACGVLDLTAALVTWAIRGVAPIRILQAIASGLLGAKSFTGGAQSAALGVALHFLIAFGAATVFYAASRKLAFLTQRAILSGMAYGVAVHIFMTWIVLPLSAARLQPFSAKMFLIGLVIHMFCVGLPISLVVRRYASLESR